MVNQMIGEFIPVKENKAFGAALRILASRSRKVTCCDKNAFGCPFFVERACKFANLFYANIVAGAVTFGLQVNDVETQHIFIDYPINSTISGSPEMLSRSARAITHAEHEIDDHFFERCRFHCSD